jgi:hypothetical protein
MNFKQFLISTDLHLEQLWKKILLEAIFTLKIFKTWTIFTSNEFVTWTEISFWTNLYLEHICKLNDSPNINIYENWTICHVEHFLISKDLHLEKLWIFFYLNGFHLEYLWKNMNGSYQVTNMILEWKFNLERISNLNIYGNWTTF